MTQLLDIVVPSESFEGTRSQLVRWLKALGQPVAAGEPLVEVETEKVTMEIHAPASGVLREILKQEQAEITVGDVLGRIAAGDETDSESVPPAPAAERQPAVSPAPTAHAQTPATLAASPAVRRLLAQHDLSAEAIRGTGADGRITIDDVLRHVAERAATAEVDAAPPGIEGAVRRVPHSALRRRIAERMVESLLKAAPHVTTVFEADLGAVVEHRARHRAAFAAEHVPLTLTAYFVAACVPAIRAVPEANARWSYEALEIYERIDIGIATAVEGRGLVVPVIRDVAGLDLKGIAVRLDDLTQRARADRLIPADVRGGTFTISNHGISGSLLAAPIIINQPQSAILGVGKLEKRAVAIERDGVDAVIVRPRCYVTLTLDHRVMDGHQANRFLRTWVSTIEGWPA
ncbi:MAG TPA: dihydrolipoamide acetyltransferase family protein [Steroidobacteraceae bacterium]|nr:dihydrolipoamide acetyltransferase family protein [Steroidobacteraceae bacterium]